MALGEYSGIQNINEEKGTKKVALSRIFFLKFTLGLFLFYWIDRRSELGKSGRWPESNLGHKMDSALGHVCVLSHFFVFVKVERTALQSLENLILMM